MLAHKRKELIKEMVDKYRIVRVSDLSERFSLSDATIRRDLKELEESGLLKRTHGGAIKISNAGLDPSLVDLETVRVREKMLIAQKAYEQIRDNDAIILDASSTVAYLPALLKAGDRRNITLVTNSFRIVSDLLDCEHVDVIHVGGQVRRKLQSSIGPIAESALRSLIVDKAFLGCNGVDFRCGFTTTNLYECQIKRMMMQSANETYILADSSKYHQSFLSVVAQINQVDYLITDDGLDHETISMAEKSGIHLILTGNDNSKKI